MDFTEDEKSDLLSLVQLFDLEDRAVRERQIRNWRRLKLYWDGFSRIWYDDVAHDWRIYGLDQIENPDNGDAAYYDKPINVFRAYLETIIAALSVSIPGVVCVPDDADNPSDVATAKAGKHIAELIYKHNNAPWLWLHALFVLCTEGMVACYSYTKEDDAYGTYDKKIYKDDVEEQYICPGCGMQLPDDTFTTSELDEFAPDDEDIVLQDLLVNEHQIVCPQCGVMLDPGLQKTPVPITKFVGVTKEPKSRQCMEVYGGLYVKVPNYALRQEDMPYLMFSYETHYTCVIERYPDLRDKVYPGGKPATSGGISTPYESWARLSTQYRGDYPINTLTVRNCWVRPSSFNMLDKEKAEKYKKKFPNGAKVVVVNDCFADACNEALDDCWTLTRNPLSDYVHFEPLGMSVTSTQDITSDLISLTLQTVEQGIQSSWADPQVMDFDAYRNSEASPGSYYPIKPQPAGTDISKGFYQTKAASLSPEVMPFGEQVQNLGQLASGAFPSLGGFQAEQGSNTASEYAMSRQQAQQRQGILWKMMIIWWKEIFGKVIPAYIEDMTSDERLVKRNDSGGYVTVMIKLAELNGRIGDVELETSETLPITDEQKRDVLMKLIELNNPEVLQMLALPENIPMVRKIVGLDNFFIPGEDSRAKQLEEIQQLMASNPIDEITPSVVVDPELDDHMVEAETTKSWLIGEEGRAAKIDNPMGYMNVLLHYKMHNMIAQQQMQAQMQAQMAMQGDSASSPAKPNGKVPEAPVKENSDAQTPVH